MESPDFPHPRAVTSLRPFIGARDYGVSQEFYRALGFSEVRIDAKMSYFRVSETVGFYLQDAYVQDWVDNSMLFLEVEEPEDNRERWLALDLPARFAGVRLSEVRYEDWGREFFLHDPSGVLWHVGCFTAIR